MAGPHLNNRQDAAMQAAINAGGSLDLLQSLYGNSMTDATNRYNANQSSLQAAQDALLQAAQGGATPQALDTLVGAYGDINPYLANNPKASAGLDQLSNTLIPQGQSQSSLYMPGPTDPATQTPDQYTSLPTEDAANMYSDALVHAQGNADNPPISLHEARTLMVGSLRAQGYSEAAIQQAYDVIGRAYEAAGGAIDAPISTAQMPQNIPSMPPMSQWGGQIPGMGSPLDSMIPQASAMVPPTGAPPEGSAASWLSGQTQLPDYLRQPTGPGHYLGQG